jgi:hypothetical protein
VKASWLGHDGYLKGCGSIESIMVSIGFVSNRMGFSRFFQIGSTVLNLYSIPAKTLSAPKLYVTLGYKDFAINTTILVNLNVDINLSTFINAVYS